MSTTVLTIKRGSLSDSMRWLWFLDVNGEQLAQGVEETRAECFDAATAAATYLDLRNHNDPTCGGAMENPMLKMPREEERRSIAEWTAARKAGKRKR